MATIVQPTLAAPPAPAPMTTAQRFTLLATGLGLSAVGQYTEPNYFPEGFSLFPAWPVFDPELALKEAYRCLNCDVETVFTGSLCIECDACVDICPTDCITFTENGEEADLRTRLKAPSPNVTQDLYVANDLKTGRVMVKDEDVCLHCGLCAERCPTGAWDMKKFYLETAQAPACPSR